MLKWIFQISSSMVSEEKTFLTFLHIPPIPNYSTENCLQFMCLTSYFILNLPSFLSILQISTASTASSACCWSDCPVLHLFPKAQEIKEDFFSLTSRHLHILVTPMSAPASAQQHQPHHSTQTPQKGQALFPLSKNKNIVLVYSDMYENFGYISVKQISQQGASKSTKKTILLIMPC